MNSQAIARWYYKEPICVFRPSVTSTLGGLNFPGLPQELSVIETILLMIQSNIRSAPFTFRLALQKVCERCAHSRQRQSIHAPSQRPLMHSCGDPDACAEPARFRDLEPTLIRYVATLRL